MPQSCGDSPKPIPPNGRVISSFQSFLCDWTRRPTRLLQLWAELTLVSPLAFHYFCSPCPVLPVPQVWPSLPVESPSQCFFVKLAFQFVFLANRIHLPFYKLLLYSCARHCGAVYGGVRERGERCW